MVELLQNSTLYKLQKLRQNCLICQWKHSDIKLHLSHDTFMLHFSFLGSSFVITLIAGIPATFMNGFHIYCECTTYIGSSFPVELFCVNINQFYGIFLWKSFQMENFPMQLGGPDLRTHVKSIHEGVQYPVTNVFTKLLRRVTSGHMLNQFMKVFVILATIVIIKLLTRVTSEHIKNTNIMS